MVKDGCWSSKHGVSIIPSADVLATHVKVANVGRKTDCSKLYSPSGRLVKFVLL